MNEVDFDLNDRLLVALQSRGFGERLRLRFSGGFTSVQLLGRLAMDDQAALQAGHENPTVAQRQALDRIQICLRELEAEGKVQRTRVNLKTDLRGKGTRRVIVEVYRSRKP